MNRKKRNSVFTSNFGVVDRQKLKVVNTGESSYRVIEMIDLRLLNVS